MMESHAALLFLCALISAPILWHFMAFLQRLYMHAQENRLPKIEYRIAKNFQHNKFSRSAGCIVEQDGKIVFVHYPFSFHNFWCSWMHSIPGGTAKEGLMAWQVAALETFEEAGVEVEILDEIIEFDGFILFLARPIKPITEEHLQNFNKTFEIKKISLRHPDDLDPKHSRFPDQHVFLQNWFKGRK